jgi:6-pyruvoyltetrahydropterin/6-carboxytetrahydropterin synthase
MASGPVDPVTGMVVNIKRIDDWLQERVVSRYDQRSLNDEAPEFAGRAPTLENFLLVLSLSLRDLPDGASLVGLKLEETPLLYGEWARDPEMLTITRVYEFAASHRLHSPALGEEENLRLYGKCNHPAGHGHNYVLEVTVTGPLDPRTGMLAPIDEIDQVVRREVLDRYDHRNLDVDVPELQGKVSTSEVVAQAIFDRLEGRLPARLVRVRLHETARNVFEVTR